MLKWVPRGTHRAAYKSMKESVKGFIETLTTIVTQTNRSVDDFMRSHKNLTKLDGTQHYFRSNVKQGLQGIGLEEFAKTIIEAATQDYMRSPQQKNVVALCAKSLRLKLSVSFFSEIVADDFS